jgi:hypothetical protein
MLPDGVGRLVEYPHGTPVVKLILGWRSGHLTTCPPDKAPISADWIGPLG